MNNNEVKRNNHRVLLSMILVIALLSICFSFAFASAAGKEYTVTLDAGRGFFEENGQKVKTIQRVYNESKEINYTGDWDHQYYSCIPNPPGDSELLFTRWCTSPDLSEETELAEGTIINSDTTLYANYDYIFTVNIDAQGQ